MAPPRARRAEQKRKTEEESEGGKSVRAKQAARLTTASSRHEAAAPARALYDTPWMRHVRVVCVRRHLFAAAAAGVRCCCAFPSRTDGCGAAAQRRCATCVQAWCMRRLDAAAGLAASAARAAARARSPCSHRPLTHAGTRARASHAAAHFLSCSLLPNFGHALTCMSARGARGLCENVRLTPIRRSASAPQPQTPPRRCCGVAVMSHAACSGIEPLVRAHTACDACWRLQCAADAWVRVGASCK
jgi:hypothetical protein